MIYANKFMFFLIFVQNSQKWSEKKWQSYNQTTPRRAGLFGLVAMRREGYNNPLILLMRAFNGSISGTISSSVASMKQL